MWKLLSRESAHSRDGSAPPSAGGDAQREGEPAGTGGYDRVAVPVDGSEPRWMTKGQFQALALTDRVRLLAGGGLRFYRGAQEIAPSEAMRGLP
jgi:hypothetical protein